jgi:hypothetical protein
VTDAPEKGRDATGQGRDHGPDRRYLLGSSTVPGLSPPTAIDLTDDASRRECTLVIADQPPREGGRQAPLGVRSAGAEPNPDRTARKQSAARHRQERGGAGAGRSFEKDRRPEGAAQRESWDSPAGRWDCYRDLHATEGQSHR